MKPEEKKEAIEIAVNHLENRITRGDSAMVAAIAELIKSVKPN